ncbi:hypothetical protein AB685_09835 [Bacillus sp. LL01]|nr:hypothetical protein AB685_09835 [Bacillus sp. LL01]
MFIIVLVITLVTFSIYNRYVPVIGVPCVRDLEQSDSFILIVDVRDYNYVQDTVPNTTNIPVAYLQRNHKQLNGEKVIVLASSHMEKNISVRFMKKRGIEVVGYSIMGSPCRCTKLTTV